MPTTRELMDRIERLESALAQTAVSAAAWEAIGQRAPGAALSIAPLKTRLRADVHPDGVVEVRVVGDDGRTRFIARNGSAPRPLTPDEALSELRQRYANVFDASDSDGSRGATDTGQPGRNLTDAMATERKRLDTAAGAPLTVAERQTAAAMNPWSTATFNLTEQMRLIRRDPLFAESLKRRATVVV
jgi:hypothetical protein